MVTNNSVITKEQCDLIVATNPAFYRIDTVVDGVNVFIYNYRLASITDFTDALRDNSNLQAFELRGITFVEQPDGSFERFLALSKFFNYSETVGWMPEDLAAKHIRCVYDKLDGSMIHFIRLPNGKFVAKTKQVFDSDQAIAANKILEKSHALQAYLSYMYKSKTTPIFEYTAPDNHVVIPYSKQELTVIQVRLNESGAYLPVVFTPPNINRVDSRTYSLHDLTRMQKTVTGEEGWIANMDGKLVKFKTDWYFIQHRAKEGLSSNKLSLFELVMNDGFDDAISLLDPSFSELKQTLEQEASLLRHWYNHAYKEVQHAVDFWNEHFQTMSVQKGYAEAKKHMVMLFKQNQWFHVIIQVAEKKNDLDKTLREYMLKKYNKDTLVVELLNKLKEG